MQSRLEGRAQKVKINSELSSALSCVIGLPHISILGPPLYSLCINDVNGDPTVCNESEIHLYADDTIVYVHAMSKQQAPRKLTAVMTYVTQWLINSCLHLNIKKTVSMFFTKRSISLCNNLF